MKYYEYVDESGRDPFAPLFIVGIVLLSSNREELYRRLLSIEEESGKGIRKWKKSENKRRQRYVELVSQESDLQFSLYYVKYDKNGDYFIQTADAIARTLKDKKKGDQITTWIDGLRRAELNQVKRQLKPSVKGKKVVVKSIKREESNPFIRLADTVCGLVRDADEGIEWAKKAVTQLQNKKLLQGK